jgi:hypothetical protein
MIDAIQVLVARIFAESQVLSSQVGYPRHIELCVIMCRNRTDNFPKSPNCPAEITIQNTNMRTLDPRQVLRNEPSAPLPMRQIAPDPDKGVWS